MTRARTGGRLPNPNMDSELTSVPIQPPHRRGGDMALHLLSQLAHVELTTPTPEKSLEFWTQVVGLEETARAGQSVYLRGWGDRFHHTLQLTEGRRAGARTRRLARRGARGARDRGGASASRRRRRGLGRGRASATGRAFRYRAPGRSPARALLGGRALHAAAGHGVAVPEPAAALRAARDRGPLHRPRDDHRRGPASATPSGTATRSATGSWSTP